jgi:protein-tyrosine phosphatase
MEPTLFTISRTGRGRLATMTRPRGGDWLTDELRDLAAAGVNVLVSLLSRAEVAELDLGAEADAARAAGIEFHWLPTPDRQVPDRAAVLALGRVPTQKLSDGQSVAVHCRHGIGRSSTLAAVVLVLEGVDPAAAWARISAARGIPVPDTGDQRAFIYTLTPVT